MAQQLKVLLRNSQIQIIIFMKTKPTFPNLCSLLCLSNYFSVFLLFCLLVSLGELFAQPVTLDPTFGENGMTVLPVKGKISLIDFDKHGNIIAVGVTNIEGKDYLTIVKTNANGILDQNFGTNGKITILGYIPEVEVSPIGLKITKENKILINGSFDIIDQGTRRRMFMQFNGDGSFDETFGENGKIFLTMGGTYTRAVNLENDDFMWIGGNVASTFLPFISKYNYNGEIDESFGENGKLYLTDNETFNITPHAIKILHDNTILVAGSNYSEVAFCKITQGGNFVTDFANNGIWKKHIYTDPHSETWVSFVDAIEDHNGNLTLLGTCFEIRPNFAKSFVCHFHPDGNISSNFGVDGFYYYSWFFSTNIDSYLLQKILQNENRYIIGACYKVISLLPDGTIDTSFNNTGVYNCENFTFKDFKLQRKDKLILGGTNGNFAIIRLQIPAHLSVDAGGNQHFCYDGGDFKEAILGVISIKLRSFFRKWKRLK